jgi:hypothetical protein
MWAYALIATGLLNWDYQRNAPHIAAHSLAIVIPGLVLLLSTFFTPTRKLLTQRASQIAWFLIGAGALAYAFLN